MAKRGKLSKSCTKRNMELDRISNLPSDVIGKILSFLPIKEAVKTSILSSKWRFQSAMLPHLVFDDQCFSTQNHKTFENIVDQVLLLHIGPIHTFKLSRPDLPATSEIDRWIRHLSRNSVNELILHIWKGDPYKIPSCLFSCQDMVHLELYNCSLKPPSTCKGFRSLKSLCIDEVTMAQDVFDNVIVSCPLLERLTLTNCCGFTHVKIHAPNLKFFHFEGLFEHVTLENTLSLAEVYIYLDFDYDRRQAPASYCHLIKFFVHLPHIRRLTIQGYFLQYLAVGALPGKLPKPCLYLSFLSIDIYFSDPCEVLAAQCLLRSSPALQELEIMANHENQDQAVNVEVKSWLDANQNWSFTQLRLVKITSFSGSEAELDFIKFLLSSSPLLEILTVKPAASVVDSLELLKRLIRFRRASVHSEIVYLEP
ncbi:hypothetical protein CerSpe_284020 [Prunus speciosa]